MSFVTIFLFFLLPLFHYSPVQAAINKITRGPYLQQLTENSVIIRWRTKKPTASMLEITRESSDQTIYFADRVISRKHKMLIHGLKPKQEYGYKIKAQKKSKVEIIENDGDESSFNFKTKDPNDSTVVVWVLGDPGVKGDKKFSKDIRKSQDAVKEAFTSYMQKNQVGELDFILTLGDNAYSHGTDKEYQKGFFEPYSKFLSSYNLYSVFGNHDGGIDKEFMHYSARSYPYPRGIYYDNFSLPGHQAYYSFNHGDAHFVVLDSFDSFWENYRPEFDNYEKPWTEKSPEANTMLEWLKLDLLSNQKQWTIVAFHHPPFNVDNLEYEKQDIWRAWMNAYVLPILHEHQVDLVLSGHIHNYQRTFPLTIRAVTKPEQKQAKEKEIKGFKKNFVEKYKKLLKELNLPNYDPVVISRDQSQYQEDQGISYCILGSSGAAFKDLSTENIPDIFAKRLQKPGSVLLEIDSQSISYKFIGHDAKILDEFTINKNK